LQSAIQGGLSEVHEAALSPLSMMKKFVQASGKQEQTENGELQQLRLRLAELESRMKPSAKKTKRTKKPVA
jgi:hypothetical protein